MPPTKSFTSGTWASTLLPAIRSAWRPSAASSLRSLDAEELDEGGDALLDRDLRDVRGRLDAKHRDALGQEVLQQVAVVAGKLDDEAGAVQPETIGDEIRIALRVLAPSCRHTTKNTRTR